LDLTIEWNTLKHLGLGVGYNYTQINLNYSGSDNFVNRIRYDIGAGTKVFEAWRVELRYVLQDGRAIEDLFNDPFSSDEHILRLRLFYTFN
jgi:hypothetical protein